MKPFIAIIGLPVLLGFLAAKSAAETFTLETTYPSPLGAYDKVDLNQLRLNGYTQTEINDGALQTAAEKLAGDPPAAGRLFFNKDNGYLYYTAINADPADKSTWYMKIMPDTSTENIYVRGAGKCVLYKGALASDNAAKKLEPACNSWLAFNNVTNLVGKVTPVRPATAAGAISAGYEYILTSLTAQPTDKRTWSFNATCRITMSGLALPQPSTGLGYTATKHVLTKGLYTSKCSDLAYPLSVTDYATCASRMDPNPIGLYKQTKQVLAVKLPTKVDAAATIVYEPLTATDNLRFNYGYYYYTNIYGNPSVSARSLRTFKFDGSSYYYDYAMAGTVAATTTTTTKLAVQIDGDLANNYISTDGTTYTGDTTKYVYYISNPNAVSTTAQTWANLYIDRFSQTMECTDVSAGIPND